MVTKSKPKRAKVTGWRAVIRRPGFAKKYGIFSAVVLLVTVLFWSIKGADLQQGNADQLVDPHLFENAHTLQQALLPGAHTFLLKWPLFWLIKLFSFSNTAFISVTVLSVLATVGGLVLLLSKIERRPLVLGTICLALASVLLLVPAQPYAGSLLPVNMAMLATRNLEYLLYIGSLVLFVKSPRFKSLGFWLAVICLGILIASDRLFLYLSVGGAILAMLAYALTRGWKLTGLAARWLVASGLAAAVSAGLIWLIQASKLTHIDTGSSLGPYNLVKNAHDLAIGVIYAVGGLLTNFGANPAYHTTIIRNVPHDALAGLFSLGGPAYIVNALILVGALFMAYRIAWLSLTHHRMPANKGLRLDGNSILAVMLLSSAVVAIVVFVATNHYFAVDARYLSIALFALFVAVATFSSKRSWQPDKVMMVGAILLLSVILGVLQADNINHKESSALNDVNQRNALIAQVVQHRNDQILVGDYWRVLPVKQMAGSNLTVTPLDGCTQPRQALSSQSWQLNLNHHSFAYLLTLDGNLTNYPSCSLKQVVAAYGRPNSSALIAGTLSKPLEVVLFYDHGIHKDLPPTSYNQPKDPAAVVPVSLSELPSPTCNKPTVMTVVAHEDDDLLFTSPDLLHDIQAGYCVRTVYVTAGDAGNGRFYWLGREQGSEAAYSYMTPTKDDIWVQRIVQLPGKQYITVSSPRNNLNVSLVFMHLPDGNLKGEGFKASHYESLAKLDASKISVIHTVDGQSSYTAAQLTDTLTQLIAYFQPTTIHTQANFISKTYPDHSDHMAVGRFVKRAYTQYEDTRLENLVTIPIKYYIGYPIHQMAPNVSGQDLQAKQAAYFAYSLFDGAVCHSMTQCRDFSSFGAYLQRQYESSY